MNLGELYGLNKPGVIRFRCPECKGQNYLNFETVDNLKSFKAKCDHCNAETFDYFDVENVRTKEDILKDLLINSWMYTPLSKIIKLLYLVRLEREDFVKVDGQQQGEQDDVLKNIDELAMMFRARMPKL